jgi:hypothetical protein
MYYKKFNKSDIVHNTIVTHPEYEFFINNQEIYLNRESDEAGDFSNTIKHVSQGHISMVEMNVNRPSNKLVAPFFVYDNLRQNMFGGQIGANYQSGDHIEGVYPMSASVSRIYYDHSAANNNIKYINALRNPIELSGELSSDNDFNNFNSADTNIIAIPSIFYGSRVKRGSIKLNFYVTGTLAATLEDTKKNGKLIETYGPNEGQVAGIALYDYGMMLLTSSNSLHSSHTDSYGEAGSSPSWLSFGSGIPELTTDSVLGSNHSVSADPSYSISFEGTNKIPTMTLMAHAEKGEYNYSTNPTFVDYTTPLEGVVDVDYYKEKVSNVKNIRKSKYDNYEEEYENTTYISQVGIYDKDKNLVAIAKLANPVKKTEIQDYLFKLRLDF